MKIEFIFITEGVHRNEFSNFSELNKLLDKYSVKVNFFQKELNGRMKIYNSPSLDQKHCNGVIA